MLLKKVSCDRLFCHLWQYLSLPMRARYKILEKLIFLDTYTNMKSRKKSRRIDSYEKPKTVKQQLKFPYKRVRIDWIDIITEGGWGSEKEFTNMKLATPVSEGWLFSKDSDTVRIFAGYDVDDDG